MANPIRPTIKTELLPALLIVASFVASWYFYQNFPDQVATHWNVAGEVDDYSSKTFAAFFFPAFSLGLYLLFLTLPYLDPNKDRYVQFAKVYHIFKNLIIGTMTFIYAVVGLAGLGYPVPVETVMPLVIGIMFIVMGNYMGKIKPNWFMGIRTPWTLSNEEVWNKTHRLGGKLFMVAGALLLVISFYKEPFAWYVFIASAVFVAIVPMIYSLVLYKKLKKNN